MSSAAEAAPGSAAAEPLGIGEFIPAGVLLLLILACAQRGTGFMICLLLPLLLVWLARMAWVAWRHRARRRTEAMKLSLLLGAICVFALLHGLYHRLAREHAQHVVDSVSAYHLQHGAYPSGLAQIGLDAKALRRDWHIYYYGTDFDHSVTYADSFNMFDTYAYQLEKPGWVFHPD